jgi:alkyldihydroxyacetonephosphate synthase
MTTARERSWWGWGYRDAAVDVDGRTKLAMLLSTQFDVSQLETLKPPLLSEVELPKSRIALHPTLGPQLSAAALDRASHTYGKAFRDVVRGLRGEFDVAPDLVAYPRDEHDVVALLDWCSDQGYAVIPFGGGSSVVGGVEARCRDDYPGVVSMDLSRMVGVTEVDDVSRAALIEAGSFGPAIEAELKPHGLSLRHYPQSFEFSTLGGWLATRAGGHFATLYTHIDDLVESMTVVTPGGTVVSRRLPASGAGPSPDRMFLGSEGALGIIVRAWMRLQRRPEHRASASVRFDDFHSAIEVARLLAQSGLYPSNCRLLDPNEALINGIGDSSFLLVAFESHDHPLDAWMTRALEICRSGGGEPVDKSALASAALSTADLVSGDAEGASDRWRKMFLRGPYLRDGLVRVGAITETFETACTWRDFPELHRGVLAAARDALDRICGGGMVSSRVTHVYPDGLAPYYTLVAPAKANSQVAQWDEIKAAVSEALLAAGGTITHHHAVGRDHRPWYDRQRPQPFADALKAAKRSLDPAGVLNPGVLV